jgi:hypothetical protein
MCWIYYNSGCYEATYVVGAENICRLAFATINWCEGVWAQLDAIPEVLRAVLDGCRGVPGGHRPVPHNMTVAA